MYTVDADKDFFFQIRWHVCRTISQLQYLNPCAQLFWKYFVIVNFDFFYTKDEKKYMFHVYGNYVFKSPCIKLLQLNSVNDCFLSYFTVEQLSLLDFNTILSTLWGYVTWPFSVTCVLPHQFREGFLGVVIGWWG